MNDPYWDRIRERSKELGSDGCTGVPEFYHDCCLEHDIAYRSGKDVYGNRITRKRADLQLRKCIQQRSRFGRYSPMAWWRWTACRLVGSWSWVGIIFLFITIGCSATSNWETVAINIPAILDVEFRIDHIAEEIANSRDVLTENQLDRIKLHFDIYFVFYYGANVALADGDVTRFEQHMASANDELDRMLEIMDEKPQPIVFPGFSL